MRADDYLEVGFDRYEASAGDLHDVFIEADKDGATTCQLVAPNGTYSFTDVSGRFRPEQDFFDDHTGLSFADLGTAVSGGWTLTFDAMLTPTVAILDFGTLSDGDFLPPPTITAPADGAPIRIPGDSNPPTIEWINGSSPPDCDWALAFVANHENWWNADSATGSGEMPCTTTSWTPASPLSEGLWFITVMNTALDVPAGSSITVVQGVWTIQAGEWLDLSSIDRSQHEVVSTQPMSWGAVKAEHR